MIEELIGRVFYTRNVSHFFHWRTHGAGSYAQHMALGDFYEAIIDDLDGIVECYQGAFGLIGNIPVPTVTATDIVEHLAQEAEWIEANRAAISKGNNAVANLLDGLTGQYQTTVYKLTNLA